MPVCKRILTLSAVFFFSFSLFCQSQNAVGQVEMPKMPSMPVVDTSVKMPTISSPVVSSNGSFYVPNFQNGNSTVENSQNKTTSGDSENSSSGIGLNGTNGSNKTTGKTSSISDIGSDIYSSLLGNNNLTASDISELYDAGLFGNISSLTGSEALSGNTSIKNGNSNVNTVLLQQILASLEELKAEQNKASVDEKQKVQLQIQDAKTFHSRNASILRFKINGYNISDSITKFFFSESEPDGTFMLTGDRTYYINHKQRTETFYILFRAVKSNGAVVTYKVQPSVVQDYENENSFVYKFANLENLVAEKTGNLVVLHSVTKDLNVDLLLDIDAE